MASSIFLLALLSVSCCAAWGKSCDVPSRFWCETRELAAECGVYHQCKEREWTQYPDAPLVDFTLYYETLCPFCQRFWTVELFPTYQKIGHIMNVTVVPYGNAREHKDGDLWKFECQHGEEECLGNIIQTCTIAIVQNKTQYFPFINCMEGSSVSIKAAAEKCAKQFPVPLEDIMNCTVSKRGNELEHEMAVKTDNLRPPHTGVPWVTLNGIHTDKIENEALTNLMKLICDTYQGKKPAACDQ
ncbi:gamma-interferon-inducible lysosomal thiol reductase [Aplysia californica]|uniref:Gamma-interferon-inducible lysosomal thiol reductase n=1 Tax=Aplysia californica TaxID=6500 RepID=A0ABM1A8Z3_APLCA|nr:gamma-interferon-inducible lysosomal thiol reductase [Aplysia californica]